MNAVSSGLSAAMVPEQMAVKVLAKAQETTKEMGQQALALIDASAPRAPQGSAGHNLNVVA
ncbi:MAG: hypothetical protein H6718_21495 [Polyangiaceae bacterium]|nr:hypothetical protein [Myxococcales bacterium]MCB9587995.1 hypothetical protein [Polyangiaceae bacterium]